MICIDLAVQQAVYMSDFKPFDTIGLLIQRLTPNDKYILKFNAYSKFPF